jgi:hypothetical protein
VLCRSRGQRIQEDALCLKGLIATREAEQRGKGIPGREEGDDKDGQHCLAQLELRCVFCVEARQDEVAARMLAPVLRECLWEGAHPQEKGQAQRTHPPSIIHDAARAMRRQYHGVRPLPSYRSSPMWV